MTACCRLEGSYADGLNVYIKVDISDLPAYLDISRDSDCDWDEDNAISGFAGTVDVDVYDAADSTCTGTSSPDTANIAVQIDREATYRWKVRAWLSIANFAGTQINIGNIFLGYSATGDGGDCTSTKSASNTITSCAGGDAAYGGSVSIDPQ